MTLTARQLFALAPLGASVAFSDGAPYPPARFVKKVSTWKNSNGSGLFVKADAADPRHEWSKDSFILQTLDSPVLVVNRHFDADSDRLTFTVTPPAAGSILWLSVYQERVEVKRVFTDELNAYAWARVKGYKLAGQYSTRYERVKEDGSREPWFPV